MDGEWGALLFDNPVLRLPAALTWSFRIPAGESTVELDWLVLDTPGRQAMTGRGTTSSSYAEPGEATVDGYRFDRVTLHVTGQVGDLITVTATVSGDIDGLGRDTVAATARLRFTAFTVQLSDTTSEAAALDRLAGFTDVTGLRATPDPRGIAYRFIPA